DLAATGLRQLGHEVELADDGHGTELAPDGGEQLLPQLLARGMALPQDHKGRDHLAPEVVGAAGNTRLGDGGMPQECGLYLDGADAVGGDLDDLVRAPAEPDVAVVVHRGGVAGVVDGPAGDALPVVLGVALRLTPQRCGEAGERLPDDEDPALAGRALLP